MRDGDKSAKVQLRERREYKGEMREERGEWRGEEQREWREEKETGREVETRQERGYTCR